MGAPHKKQAATDDEDRSSSRTARAVRTVAGLALVAGGSALLLLPGPGLLMIGAGVALMPGGRRRLDKVRRVVAPRAKDLVQYMSRYVATARRAA